MSKYSNYNLYTELKNIKTAIEDLEAYIGEEFALGMALNKHGESPVRVYGSPEAMGKLKAIVQKEGKSK